MIQIATLQKTEQTTRSSWYEQSMAGTITCVICAAAYAPSSSNQQLLQASPGALEAAFMSTCHFCFRCRRPACPACWDPIHGVCGTCVQEVKLSFRTEASPLAGVAIPAKPQVRPDQAAYAPSPLICVLPGRFHSATPLSTDPHKAASAPAASPKDQPVVTEQKQMKGDTNASSDARTRSPEAVIPPPALDLEDIEEPVMPWVRAIKGVEPVVNVLLFILLLTIIALIIMAELSSIANTQIIRLLHVDIRSEVAYLVSLIRQLHW